MTDDVLSKLYRARKTVSNMLADRGYVVQPEQLGETREQLAAKFENEGNQRERLIIFCVKRDDPEEKIIVYFTESNKKIGVTPIRNLSEKMEEYNVSRAILVVTQQLTPFAREAVNEAAPKHMIEVFHENDLLVNITEHELVPRHEPLSDEAKKQLLDRYKVKETQLPRIQLNDPVARYFGLSRGQVVKIIRPSETAGRYVTYRLVM
eukprot:GDKI01042026.1.p1 GENE.GDKI01042026.1~~GDKI01042026.1.p1  ORF type:complete len:207 (+),score=63.84 GDKI01042026.1:93-713(+)